MFVPVRDMLHARQSVLARSAKCGGRVGAGGGLARGRVGSGGGGGVRRSRSADLMSMHFCLDTRLHLESQLMQTLTLMENSEHATSAKRVAERVWAVVEGGGPTAKSVCEDIEDVGVQLEMNRRKRAMGERRGGKRQGKARRLTERLRRGGRGRGRRVEGGGEGEEESVDGAGKMGGVEQSTVLHSSVNSVSEGSRAVRVRARIKREEALKGVFRRWEWMLVLVCAAAVVMRSYFERDYYQTTVMAIHNYHRLVHLNRVMRPFGEIYRDSIKQSLLSSVLPTSLQVIQTRFHTLLKLTYCYYRLRYSFSETALSYSTKAPYQVVLTAIWNKPVGNNQNSSSAGTFLTKTIVSTFLLKIVPKTEARMSVHYANLMNQLQKQTTILAKIANQSADLSRTLPLFEYNKNYSRTLFLVSLSTFEREITSTNSNLRTVASSLYFALGVNAILAVAFGKSCVTQYPWCC